MRTLFASEAPIFSSAIGGFVLGISAVGALAGTANLGTAALIAGAGSFALLSGKLGI